MSEKHLNETLWKALAAKHKIKDPGLGKSLAAYARLDPEEYDDRLKALEEVEEQTDDLAKEHAKNSEVAKYLDEVTKAVKKTVKEVEVLAKEAEAAEAEDEEGGTDPAVVKKRMLSALGRIKSQGTDGGFQFLAAIGKGDSVVMISTRKLSKKTILAMAPNLPTPKWVRGQCVHEEGAFTFVVDAIMGGLARKLRAALIQETGLSLKVRVRTADGSAVADSDTEVEGPESEDGATQPVPDAPPPPPPPPAPPSAPQTEFLARLKRIKPDLDRVIAGQVGVSAEAGRQFGAVAGLAKAREFEKALAGLPQLEALVQTGLQQLTGSTPGAAKAGDAFRQRLRELLPAIKDAIANRHAASETLRLQASEAGALGKQNDFAKAGAVLDQIEILLGLRTAPTAATAAPKPSGSGSPEEQYGARFAELEPLFLEATRGGALNSEAEKLISRLKAIWGYISQQAASGSFGKAQDGFKRIDTENLFEAIAAARGGGTGIEAGTVAKRKFLLARWRAIKVELSGLFAGLTEDLRPVDGEGKLAQAMNERVGELLNDVQQEIDEAITNGNMGVLKGLRDRVVSDELLQHLARGNSVPGVKTRDFQTPIINAVNEVEQHLTVAA